MWDDCKEIAKKVGAALAETADEDEKERIIEETAAKYHPHRFRATYCTKLLQSGIDLKTVQKLMGHKTIESTMRYLAKAGSHIVKAKVDAVQWKIKTASRGQNGCSLTLTGDQAGLVGRVMNRAGEASSAPMTQSAEP